MVFVNLVDLTVHEINLHCEKLCQCQSCFEIFSDQKEFDKHVKAVHNISSPSNFESESNAVDSKNENRKALEELESSLLTHEREEKNARRKTRGPYRKSYRMS